MNDLLPLLEIVLSIGLLVAPPTLLGRWLAGSEPVALPDFFRMPAHPARPRGTQEDDLPPFRFRDWEPMPRLRAVALDDARPRVSDRAA